MGGGKQNTSLCLWIKGGRLMVWVDLWAVIYGMFQTTPAGACEPLGSAGHQHVYAGIPGAARLSQRRGLWTGNWHIDNLFVGISVMSFRLSQGGKLCNSIKQYLGQSEDWFFLYITGFLHKLCNAWCNILHCICWSIRRHFKHSVNMFIRFLLILTLNE